MKVFSSLVLCLLTGLGASAQTKPLLEQQATLPFNAGERIYAHKVLENENKLLLVGESTVEILDLNSGRPLETRAIETARFCEDRPRVISPDARRMIIFGNYSCGGKVDKVKRPPSVWDLETGKRVATLEQTKKHIFTAQWSNNGKTLVTTSDGYSPDQSFESSVEVAFWDGETVAFKNSLPDDKVNWWYVTRDGSKCFYSLGPVKNFLFMVKFLGDNGGPLRVWDIDNGQLEKTSIEGDATIQRRIRAIEVSPDESFLTYVAQQPNVKESERRQVVWKIEKMNHARYELSHRYEVKPTPKIWEHGVSFSPDGKLFAMDAGKNLQIYETITGEKKFELADVKRVPNFWLDANKILILDYNDEMEAIETATGKRLFKQKLIYVAADGGDDGAYYVYDSTTIRPHGQRKLLLTYSKQYVKLIDAVTGEILQTLVSPTMDYSKKKPRLNTASIVYEADWTADGRGLYVINAEKTSVSLWRFVN